jgi:hypothetical protein
VWRPSAAQHVSVVVNRKSPVSYDKPR